MVNLSLTKVAYKCECPFDLPSHQKVVELHRAGTAQGTGASLAHQTGHCRVQLGVRSGAEETKLHSCFHSYVVSLRAV